MPTLREPVNSVHYRTPQPPGGSRRGDRSRIDPVDLGKAWVHPVSCRIGCAFTIFVPRRQRDWR
jgi:hypothetical protein